jgi:hypothetical protein
MVNAKLRLGLALPPGGGKAEENRHIWGEPYGRLANSPFGAL